MMFVFVLLQFVGLYGNISYAQNIYEPTAQQLQDQANESVASTQTDNAVLAESDAKVAAEREGQDARDNAPTAEDDAKVAAEKETLSQLRDAQGTYERQQAECQKKYGKPYCDCKDKHGIYLNTNVPFIGRCLVPSSDGSEGINILKALTKILMTFVMIGGFGTIVWGGAQIASGDVGGGKSKIIGVMVAFALLGSLGAILRFINPNFFS